MKPYKNDPLRPTYHFLPEANWMNDPNGPIYYDGEYHLFFQHNPFENKWGKIHWGHAQSSDLVYWKRLPIALSPKKGIEAHCFSGDCIIHKGIPKIIYTSIGLDKSPTKESEQWIAIGDKEMLVWEKPDNNPILSDKIHKDLKIHDWRDPFLWKENDKYYMILGGHIAKTRQPVVLLYQSSDNLNNWVFLNPMCIGNRKDKKQGRNWECPNFFKLQNKNVLIVSPHREVIYNIGDYKNKKFFSTKWRILDYSRNFYATNILKDDSAQIILFGWIRCHGQNWSGCLSLPKVLRLFNNKFLTFQFHIQLKKLREEIIIIKSKNFSSKKIAIFENQNYLSHEMYVEFKNTTNFELSLEISSTKSVKVAQLLHFNTNNELEINNKSIDLPFDDFNIHLYLDHSVCELIIGGLYCETIILDYEEGDKFSLFLKGSELNESMNILKTWKLKSIWNN